MKSKSAKVAVSLPPELLDEVERARSDRGETRSEFVRRALVHFLRGSERKDDVARYLEAYREQPDDAGAWAAGASVGALAEEPWE